MKNINFINKLRTEPKFRKNAIAIAASALVLVICAVSIPVGLHIRGSKVQQSAAENTTASISEPTTVSADVGSVSITEPTTLAAMVNETTTAPAATTQGQNNKINNNNGNSSSTSNKTASGSSNSSGSGSGNKTDNQNKPATTKAPTTTKKAQTTTQSYNYNWSQSQVNNFIAKSRTYGENIGLIWDDSFNLTNASWQLSIHSRYSGNSENEVYEKMKELIEYTKTSSGAKYFKIYPEQNDGGWEFTILWMK